MPWQPSGNGRSGWSTKLIRGLKAEAAAGFQSRRERCCEPTPVTPQYAAFQTYKAARVHSTSRGGNLPDHGAGGAGEPNFELQSVICFRSASPQQARGVSALELRPD